MDPSTADSPNQPRMFGISDAKLQATDAYASVAVRSCQQPYVYGSLAQTRGVHRDNSTFLNLKNHC